MKAALACAALCWSLAAAGQAPPAVPPPAASLSRALFTSLESLQSALAVATPDRWRAKGAVRARFATDRAAIERNLAAALPGLALGVAAAPLDLGAVFRLYRDADAVYSVALRVAGLMAQYAPGEQAQAATAALGQVHQNLNALADYIQQAGSAQSAELARLRAVHDAPPPAPPKTLIINNANAPPPHRHAVRKKKKVKKMPAPPKPSPAQ